MPKHTARQTNTHQAKHPESPSSLTFQKQDLVPGSSSSTCSHETSCKLPYLLALFTCIEGTSLHLWSILCIDSRNVHQVNIYFWQQHKVWATYTEGDIQVGAPLPHLQGTLPAEASSHILHKVRAYKWVGNPHL